MEFSERIAAIIKHYNLQGKELAELCGVQRTAIHHILNGRNRPSVAFLSQLSSAFPEINTRWLLHGKGSMFTSVTNRQEDVLEAKKVKDHLSETTVNMIETDVATTLVTSDVPTASQTEQQAEKNPSSQPPEITDVNEEDRASYSVKAKKGKVLRRLIFIYDDGTFEQFDPSA